MYYYLHFRYVKNNVLSLEQSKSYSHHLPEFLKGKPKMFVEHCVKRMPPQVEFIDHYQVEKQQSSDSLKFTVSNYTIDYDLQIPHCSCPDFSKYHWPCKHVLAIFHHYPEHGWDSLHRAYQTQPCFNLDLEVLPTKSK